MKRLNGYLRALTAVTAEERYGDKVDKQWHCEGYSGDGYHEPREVCYKNCEGKTWREKFEDSREMWKEIGPLTEVRIESRELPAWNTETTMANDEEFKFGDIIRLSDAYIESVPTAFKGVRLMVVVAKTGLIVERGGHYESPVGDLRPYERTVWTKVDD